MGRDRHDQDLRPLLEVSLLEGPAADVDGSVVFSDVIGDRLYRATPGETPSYAILRSPAGRANGNAFDADGHLITCEGAEHGPGGGRRIVRQRRGALELEVLAERYRGGRLNSPNDLTVDDQGRIFFTDPRYGDRSDIELDEAVYRLDPDGTLDQIITQPAVQRPNGIAVRPDGRELYVVDSAYDTAESARRVWAFELDDTARPMAQRLVYDFGRGRGGDGMEVDAEGLLYVCAGIARPRSRSETADVSPGVYRLTPEGRLVDVLAVPVDVVTNCCFGGPDMRTLYVTAGHRLFTTRVAVPGWHAWRWTSPS